MNYFQSGLLLEAIEEASDGIVCEERSFSGGKTTRVVLPEQNDYHRPAGTYITVELEQVQQLQQQTLWQAITEISEILIPMIRGRRVLVAALGNNDITPDSLGPKMMAHLMVTRPLELLEGKDFAGRNLRSVAAVCTNVLGTTGVESAEMIAGISGQIGAECVIVIDALATTHLSRLCSTVQIADSGIAPGAGVGNHRKLLSAQSLGVPVISIGMPTVMNARTLAYGLCEDEERINKALSPYGEDLILTPTAIGSATDNGAKLIAFSLNRALHYRLGMEEMLGYLS